MFLPVNLEDMQKRQIEQLDFICITGDAYIDHPSFGIAIISRVLDIEGYKVGIISQPLREKDYMRLGKPRLAFLVSSGNIDSIVNHYSVSRKRRETDAYTENGEIGKRPDYAVNVYCNKLKKLFPESIVIIGGIEASLRRLAHYDYYSNQIRKSILIDSSADILIYGMGEKSIIEVAGALDNNIKVADITYIRGTVFKTNDKEKLPHDAINLPSFRDICDNKVKYAESFKIQYNNTDAYNSEVLVEEYDGCFIIQNPPSYPLEKNEMDWVYSLPYERKPHPMYKGKIPAIEEIEFSITANRGCIGSCSFCALNFHQGRIIQSRSKDSIVSEAEKIIAMNSFKGYIHDIGGPTANFYKKACFKQETEGACVKKRCLFPKKCTNLIVDHSEYLDILKTVRSLPKVKKVFVRSGIRYDYLMYDGSDEFFEELVKHHISGQLKVAPEHVSNKVLGYMQKPGHELYLKFVQKYNRLNEKHNKNQFLVPYLMSSHPGCELSDAIELALYLKENNMRVKQVQDFYPTPGTLSTCMYYTKIDPRTMQKVYVTTSPHEKAMQRALIQYHLPQNYDLIKEALNKAGRRDLIGNEKKCLIKYKKDLKK